MAVLHHGLVAFSDLKMWDEVTGITNRTFEYFGDMDINVYPVDHPIAKGLEPWTLKDETFKMGALMPECRPVLTTNCKNSSPVIAWTNSTRARGYSVLTRGMMRRHSRIIILWRF